jgi:hypothetical protein
MRHLDHSNPQDRYRSFKRLANLVMLASTVIVLLLVGATALALQGLFDINLSFELLALLWMVLLFPVSAGLDRVMYRKRIQSIYNTPLSS